MTKMWLKLNGILVKRLRLTINEEYVDKMNTITNNRGTPTVQYWIQERSPQNTIAPGQIRRPQGGPRRVFLDVNSVKLCLQLSRAGVAVRAAMAAWRSPRINQIVQIPFKESMFAFQMLWVAFPWGSTAKLNTFQFGGPWHEKVWEALF